MRLFAGPTSFCYNRRRPWTHWLRDCCWCSQTLIIGKIWWKISDVWSCFACPSFLTSKLSSLFTALIRHGYIAKCLSDSIIQPIPKGLKDPAKSTNYHGIALASCLSKILELCILMSFPDAFSTSDLQFGYKKGFSTDLWGVAEREAERCSRC